MGLTGPKTAIVLRGAQLALPFLPEASKEWEPVREAHAKNGDRLVFLTRTASVRGRFSKRDYVIIRVTNSGLSFRVFHEKSTASEALRFFEKDGLTADKRWAETATPVKEEWHLPEQFEAFRRL